MDDNIERSDGVFVFSLDWLNDDDSETENGQENQILPCFVQLQRNHSLDVKAAKLISGNRLFIFFCCNFHEIIPFQIFQMNRASLRTWPLNVIKNLTDDP